MCVPQSSRPSHETNTLPPKKDCAEPSVAPDVLVLPYAAAAAPGLSFGRRRCRPSPGGVCEPGQDRVLRLRLGRGCVRRVPSGPAALHARQAGLFQDAKPQQRLSPGAPPRPAHPTAHSFTRPSHHREVSTAATTARATRRSRTARGRGSPTRLWKDSRCPIAGRSRAGALSRWI